MTVSTAVSFGPRRIALWGLVWALAVAACETLLAYRLDDMRLAPLAGWLMLHWLVPLWWLNGCALVWIVQRAERHAGVGAMAIGLLLVSLVNGLLQPVLGWLVAPLRIALAEAGLLAMMTLMPTRDLTAALELAVYNFWIGIFYGGLLMIAAVVVARRERMQHLLQEAALAQGRAQTLLDSERVLAQQRQIDPRLLLAALGEIQVRYRTDVAAGDRLLGLLVAFLQSAMPGLRERQSTLARELTLARAYLDLQTERGLARHGLIDAAPAAERLAVAFPSLLVLPLLALADAARGAEILVRENAGALAVSVSGLCRVPDPELEERIRHCLQAQCGGEFSLRIEDTPRTRVEIVLGTSRQGEHHVH